GRRRRARAPRAARSAARALPRRGGDPAAAAELDRRRSPEGERMKDDLIPEASADGAHAEAPAAEAPILVPRVGFVAGIEEGALLVDFDGNRRGPIRARAAIALDDRSALDAAATRAEVVL